MNNLAWTAAAMLAQSAINRNSARYVRPTTCNPSLWVVKATCPVLHHDTPLAKIKTRQRQSIDYHQRVQRFTDRIGTCLFFYFPEISIPQIFCNLNNSDMSCMRSVITLYPSIKIKTDKPLGATLRLSLWILTTIKHWYGLRVNPIFYIQKRTELISRFNSI